MLSVVNVEIITFLDSWKNRVKREKARDRQRERERETTRQQDRQKYWKVNDYPNETISPQSQVSK